MLEFESLIVELPDFGPHPQGMTWANVKITFHNVGLDVHHELKAQAYIGYDESKSIAESRQQALDQTKTILQAALDLLQAHDLAALRRIEAEKETKH